MNKTQPAFDPEELNLIKLAQEYSDPDRARDLLESIVYPSASFVRSYEPYIVRTKSDEDYNGVLKKDAPDEIILATGPATEVRLARAEIAEIRPSTVSVMPAGMEQQLSKQELADLLAFLKATKWGAN